MAQANDRDAIFRQNLIDAGCDEKTTAECIELAARQREGELKLLLTSYRAELLGDIRQKQKQLDCLDYLLYRLQK